MFNYRIRSCMQDCVNPANVLPCEVQWASGTSVCSFVGFPQTRVRLLIVGFPARRDTSWSERLPHTHPMGGNGWWLIGLSAHPSPRNFQKPSMHSRGDKQGCGFLTVVNEDSFQRSQPCPFCCTRLAEESAV